MSDAWDPRNDGWFAGFVDGEGCFFIKYDRRRPGAKMSYRPIFSIALRADDLAILQQLHAAFGGRLSYSGRPYRGNGKPQWRWEAGSRSHLAALVSYFDLFPLHAKKASDYAIWRRAVLIYCARGGIDHNGQLAALRDALMSGRTFDGPDAPDVDDPFEPQMALGID